jgi:hypothetical protein
LAQIDPAWRNTQTAKAKTNAGILRSAQNDDFLSTSVCENPLGLDEMLLLPAHKKAANIFVC